MEVETKRDSGSEAVHYSAALRVFRKAAGLVSFGGWVGNM